MSKTRIHFGSCVGFVGPLQSGAKTFSGDQKLLFRSFYFSRVKWVGLLSSVGRFALVGPRNFHTSSGQFLVKGRFFFDLGGRWSLVRYTARENGVARIR